MPMYGTYLQRDCYNFFNDLEDNLIFEYDKEDIQDILNAKKKIDDVYNIMKDAWMEMTYEGKQAKYYDDFARDNNEKELLEESGYVLFDLDEYPIKLPNGNLRYWIYEKELYDVRLILRKKKKIIENHINEINVKAGVALALLAIPAQ